MFWIIYISETTMVEIDLNKQNIKLKGEFFPNLSEWSYICNNSSTEDLEPLTTLIAPVAIIPKWKKKKTWEWELLFTNEIY